MATSFSAAASQARANWMQAEGARLSESASRSTFEFQLRRLLNDRANRLRFFNEGLFADPAWDILLQLAFAEVQQSRVSVVSLCLGSGVPQTTALRWIKSMTEEGLLTREDDRLDARRKFIALSRDTSVRMTAYLEGMADGRAHRN